MDQPRAEALARASESERARRSGEKEAGLPSSKKDFRVLPLLKSMLGGALPMILSTSSDELRHEKEVVNSPL